MNKFGTFLSASLLVLMFVLVAFVVVDCSCGKTIVADCIVTSKYIKPPWTEVSTHTDSDGHTSTSTIYHPEEYRIMCREIEDGTQFDCLDTAYLYNLTEIGQRINVKARRGRWSGSNFMPHIVENQ